MNLLSCLRGNLFPKCRSFTKSCTFSPGKISVRNFMKKPTGDGMKFTPEIKSQSTSPVDRIFLNSFKCITFTVGFCGTVYVGASIWNYENFRKHKLGEDQFSDWVKKMWNTVEGYEHKEGKFRKTMNKWWNQIPDGEKIFWSICVINIFVFLCWRFPSMQSTMMTYFASNPTARVICWPMFLSTFSHYAPLHLGMNMFVLHSFCNAISTNLGNEQFLAFYLGGGVVASCVSSVFKLMTHVKGPSLGASGAILALLGYFCTKFPDAQLGIVFLPNYPFTASLAIKGVMLMDLLGIIFRWKLFDHAAHLGGAVFGVLYAMYGQSLIWGNRSYVTKVWDDLNNKYIERRKR